MGWAGLAWLTLCLAIGALLWPPLGPVGAGSVVIALFVAGALVAQRSRG